MEGRVYTEADLHRLPLGDLERLTDRLGERSVILENRDAAMPKARREEILDVWRKELDDVRRSYLEMRLDTHPNAVIASLGRLQGEETVLLRHIAQWERLPEAKKLIDEQFALCNSVLAERKKGMSQ